MQLRATDSNNLTQEQRNNTILGNSDGAMTNIPLNYFLHLAQTGIGLKKKGLSDSTYSQERPIVSLIFVIRLTFQSPERSEQTRASKTCIGGSW